MFIKGGNGERDTQNWGGHAQIYVQEWSTKHLEYLVSTVDSQHKKAMHL
jgi:hypothetical protein